jgi:dihydroneopterin aldolase/2-amino-4-hydroxy-6-hydroxymethyldihydropteridine diphosphokinase
MTSPVRAVDLDASPPGPVRAVVALGSNLGDREATLRSAVAALREASGVEVEACSPVYETDPVGGPDQPAYLNAVVLLRTTLPPRALLHACQRVEDDHGRVREERWGARTLDIDVVSYDAVVAADAELALPHPRARERAFVLVPWAAVEPGATLPGPGGGPVAGLARRAPDAVGARLVPGLSLADGDRTAP